jgi:hypothetical protein
VPTLKQISNDLRLQSQNPQNQTNKKQTRKKLNPKPTGDRIKIKV